MPTLSIFTEIGNFYSQFVLPLKRLHKIYLHIYGMTAWASRENFLTSKMLWFQENYLWNTIHNHGMPSAPQFIPSGKQRSQQRWCGEFSDTAAHWKSAQTEAVSVQSPGWHFSVYAVAQDAVHLLAKWSQESYWQQVKLELHWYSNTLQNDFWKSFSEGFFMTVES